jgi:hypothetical protein
LLLGLVDARLIACDALHLAVSGLVQQIAAVLDGPLGRLVLDGFEPRLRVDAIHAKKYQACRI